MNTASSNKNKSPANVRAIAAETLNKLVKQQGSLSSQLAGYNTRSDFPLLQEICFGSCRWYWQIRWILTQLLSKPLKRKDNDILCLLVIGLYQLRFMSLPDYAVINETVNATTQFKKPWSRGLVNAILRGYLRDNAAIEAKLKTTDLSVQTAMPDWLVQQITEDWPDHFNEFCLASTQRPPMVLRVNESTTDRGSYIQTLQNSGIGAREGEWATTAIYLETASPVADLPGFLTGDVSVQDESSQLIPPILQLKPRQRVLDACAAPGGKSCHILESECALTTLVAIDISANRVEKIQENLNRLDLKAELVAADVSELEQWWDGQPFDRVLLDAPCSATGILRRHPDIKVLRTPENVKELNTIQLKLLENVWRCLKPGGLCLYTTCSVLKSENSGIIEKFLHRTKDAKYEGIAADWGVECEFGRQLLPATANDPDGFFFSLLKKKSVESPTKAS